MKKVGGSIRRKARGVVTASVLIDVLVFLLVGACSSKGRNISCQKELPFGSAVVLRQPIIEYPAIIGTEGGSAFDKEAHGSCQEFDNEEKVRMIEELRAPSRRLKRPIIGKDVVTARKKKTVSPINHFQLAFGSVPAAIAVAGVAPKITYSREELIAALRKLAAMLDRPLKLADIDENFRAGKGPLSRMVRRRFGGLAQAKKAARIRS